MDSSLSEMRQNTLEWQDSMPPLGIMSDPFSASLAQSTDDDLHTYLSQPSVEKAWTEDFSTIINPKDLERFDGYLSSLEQTGSYAPGAHSKTLPPDSLNNFKLRRRKRQHAESSDTDNSQGQGHDQAEIRRQRNRVAASKCRRKSKEKNEIMLVQEQELERRHRVLKASVDCLRDEVLNLREELLRHANCDCEPIQNHIAKSIQAVVNQPSTTAATASTAASPWKIPSPPLSESCSSTY